MTSLRERVARAVDGADGALVVLSANPIHDTGGGQRSAQMALELLGRGHCVVFVSHGRVTETVDLALEYPYPRLVRTALADAVADGGAALDPVLQPGEAVVLTQVPAPGWLPVLERARRHGAVTVYDCIDRWESELGRGWYRREAETRIAECADLRVASAPALVRHVEALVGRETSLLPNAYNGRLFGPAPQGGVERPADLPAGRVALYVGALWGGWLDWGLVRTLARALPDTRFVFVGDRRREGRGLPDNCVFLGLKPQASLPAYLHHADVAFLPWRIDDVTRATSPLKVYEFVATGLPVVAPALEPLDDVPGVVSVESPGAFVDAVRSTGRASADRAAMGSFSAAHSWERRADELLERVRGVRALGAERGGRLLSVVVPAYNHAAFIGEAIDGVEAQTLPAGELVVVDDGSGDRTPEVVREHAFPRLRYVRQENRGAHSALNRAITMSRGDHIAILNSDDAFLPERLESAWGVARATGAALLVGAVRLIDGAGRALAPDHPVAVWYRRAREEAARRRTLRSALVRHNVAVTTSNFLVHRALWHEIGGFSAHRYVHDLDFLLRALELCPDRVRYEPALDGVLYRIHGANTIGEDTRAALDERAAVLRSFGGPARRLGRAAARALSRSGVGRSVARSASLAPTPRCEPRETPPTRVGIVVRALGEGGLEQIVALLAESLAAVGARPFVLCTHAGGAVADRLAGSGVPLTVAAGRPAEWRVWAERVRPDVVSTHFADLDVVRELAPFGAPLVETIHNTYAWLDREGWERERDKVGLLAGTVAVSTTVALHHARRVGGAPTPHVVPNAVHPARAALVPRAFARRHLGVGGDAPLLVHLGRASVQKNLGGLLDAFHDVVAREPAVRLLLVGSTADHRYVRRIRRAHRRLFTSGTVRFVDSVPDVGTVLSAADAFVSNSFFEGWSVAASEAAWTGLPLVLSECGGSRELVGEEGERGRVVPNAVGDPLGVDLDLLRRPPPGAVARNREALGAALLDVIRSRADWRERAPSIREHARSVLAPGRMARAYARILRGFRSAG